jgi:hypothetical protein
MSGGYPLIYRDVAAPLRMAWQPDVAAPLGRVGSWPWERTDSL